MLQPPRKLNFIFVDVDAEISPRGGYAPPGPPPSSPLRGYADGRWSGLGWVRHRHPKKIGFKKRNVQNRPKRVSTKYHGCTNYFRVVNGRLKFHIFENAKL